MYKAVWLAMCVSAASFAQVRVESPIWSPDGKRIAFGVTFTGQGTDWNIYLTNIDGSGLRQITRTGAWDATCHQMVRRWHSFRQSLANVRFPPCLATSPRTPMWPPT
jgi:hypothetical protein